MRYIWIWADGQYKFRPYVGNIHHVNLLQDLKLGSVPRNFAGGMYEYVDGDPRTDSMNVLWHNGVTPTSEEIKFMLNQELNRFDGWEDQAQQAVAAKMAAKERFIYHVAPTHQRKSIKTYGIDSARAPYERSESTSGLYAFTNPSDAKHYAEYMAHYDPVEPFDIWEARPSYWPIDTDYGLYPDDDPGSAVHHIDPIEPENARLHSTYYPDGGWTTYKTAADIEDSEPPQNFGFLKDPHDELYPCVWKNKKMIPKAKKALKDHMNNYLKENEYGDADSWMYWTVYGSGASYNWDEDGDFDLQLWVDYTKYKDAHPDSELTADELLADIRRLVQVVNFPSFADLGLATKECAGSMLVQYYAKPGTGSEEENLAQKPYACYDMETDKWLVEPKPYGPSFYGEEFLLVMPKAMDIAVQAEALGADLDRNVAQWSFWSQLGTKLNHPYYLDIANQAQDRANLDKEAIHKLFLGVFKGRMDAYAEYGKGIEDERDAVEKMLEVWGTFQTLRHYVKAPLPWEEQEVPAEKESRYVDLSVQPLRYGDIFFRFTGKEDQFPAKSGQIGWNVLDGNKIAGSLYLFDLEETNDKIAYVDNLYVAPEYRDSNAFMKLWQLTRDYAKSRGLTIGGSFLDSRVREPFNMINTHSSLQKFADWSDIMQKAKRLKDDGQVSNVINNGTYITGQVVGDHGTYNPEIWRDDPNAQAITRWTCPCEWGQYSWGRTRQWKKFEGRPCAHTLALFWSGQQTPAQQGQSPPPADVGPQPGLEAPMSPVNPQPQIPAPMTPVGPPQGPPTMIQQEEQASEQQLQPKPPQPNPAFSQKTQFGEGSPSNVNFPGSLSHITWRDPEDDSGYYLPGHYASTAKVEGLSPKAEKELAKFWHEHEDLRAECKKKYGHDPIDDALEYWRDGIGSAEPEHHKIRKAVEENDGIFTYDVAKKWETQELAAAKKESKEFLKFCPNCERNLLEPGEEICPDCEHISEMLKGYQDPEPWVRMFERKKKFAMGLHGDLPMNINFKIEHTDSGLQTIKIRAFDYDEEIGEIWIAPKLDKPNYYIEWLNVEPEYQRRGVAEALLKQAEELTSYPIHHNWEIMSDEGEAWANEMEKRHGSINIVVKEIPDDPDVKTQYLLYHTGEIAERNSDDAGALIVQAWDNDKMVGSLFGTLQSSYKAEENPQFHVWQAHILPEYRNLGLLQDMARKLEDELGEKLFFTAERWKGGQTGDIRKMHPIHSSFQNGERVRARYPMIGIDRNGQQHKVPANLAGEVLYSDDNVAHVIFPLKSGKLEPHLVRVQASPNDFYEEEGSTPFIKRRH